MYRIQHMNCMRARYTAIDKSLTIARMPAAVASENKKKNYTFSASVWMGQKVI